MVYTWIMTHGGPDELCASCMLRFAEWQESEQLPTRWPTFEQYVEALGRYTTPYFATEADYERAVDEGHGDDHYHECYLTED